MGITVLGPLTVDGSERLGRRDRVVLGPRCAAARASGERRPAVRRAVGRPPPGVGGQEPAGVRRPAPQGAGRRGDPDVTARLRAARLPADDVDARRFEAQVGAGPRAPRARRGRPGGVPARPRRSPCGAGSRSPTSTSWAPARARGGARLVRAAPGGRGAARRRAAARPVGTARSWPAAQALVRAAPLRERRWELLALAPVPGRRSRARRCAPSASSGPCWPTQLGIDPAPDVVALEQVDPAAGPRAAGRPTRRAPAAHLPLAGPAGRTTSTTPSGSSAATATWPPASRSCARTSFARPRRALRVRASPRCCAPGWLAALRRRGQPVVVDHARAPARWSR